MIVNTPSQSYAALQRATALEVLENRLTQLTYIWGDPSVSSRLQKLVPRRAAVLLDQLQSEQREAARQAGEEVMRLCFGMSAPTQTWFGTPLGLLVFHALYRADEAKAPAGALTRAEAGELLTVSRQRVHAMIRAGQLQPHPDGGVTTESVAELLHRRREGT